MATNLVVRNVDEKIALALKLKQQAAFYGSSAEAEHRENFEISTQVGLDLPAQHLTAHQFKWIDMIGIVGLMKQAQPTELAYSWLGPFPASPLPRTSCHSTH